MAKNKLRQLPKYVQAKIVADERPYWQIAKDYGVCCAETVARFKRSIGQTRIGQGEVKIVKGRRVATPEHSAWVAMRNRCNNVRGQDYHYYGGRGIKVHPRWNKFANFLADMHRRPSDKHTLDRIDVNGNYEPSNCRWVTRRQQSQNRTDNRFTLYSASLIRKMYKTGKYRQIDIARMFGTTQAAISQITRNATWLRD